ncbi:MAG: very-long-chain enoyl-CoA reductase, partial [Streblomastix strix]
MSGEYPSSVLYDEPPKLINVELAGESVRFQYTLKMKISDVYSDLARLAHTTVKRLILSYIPFGETFYVVLLNCEDFFSQVRISPGSNLKISIMGPSINYRFGQILINLFPLLVFSTIFLFRDFIYSIYDSEDDSLSLAQVVGLFLWDIHFIKRVLESAVLHSFTRKSIEITTLLSNFVYLISFGVWIGLTLFKPTFYPPETVSVEI